MESGSASSREEIVAGAGAGLVAGIALAALTRPPGTTTAGLLDLGPSAVKLTLHLVLAVLLGGVFGAIVRYRPRAYAAAIGGGLLLGLLWWMAGPLTLKPLLEGRGPTWSVDEAGTAFPNLIGGLLYGGLMGLLSYAALAVYIGACAAAGAQRPSRARAQTRGHSRGRLRRRRSGTASRAPVHARPLARDRAGQLQ